MPNLSTRKLVVILIGIWVVWLVNSANEARARDTRGF